MGLGDFLSDILTTGVQNLPAIVSAVRGPGSPQAQSFLPGLLAGAAAAQPGAMAGLEQATGINLPLVGLPRGYAPALFRASATARGATP